MTDKELEELKNELNKEELERDIRAKEDAKRFRKICQLRSSYEEEIQKRAAINNKKNELEYVRNYLSEALVEDTWCVKFQGKLWKSKNGKFTWTSEGRALGALKNSLANFNGLYIDNYVYYHMKGKPQDFITELIENKELEICHLA